MGFDIGVSKGSPLVAKTSFASLRNENGVPHASGGFSAGLHSKFSPQNNHLRLFCYCENFVCYFSTDFVRALKVGKNRGTPRKWGL